MLKPLPKDDRYRCEHRALKPRNILQNELNPLCSVCIGASTVGRKAPRQVEVESTDTEILEAANA